MNRVVGNSLPPAPAPVPVYDVALLQRTLNGIFGTVVNGRLVPKVVTVGAARRLMVLGQKAISEAKRISPLADDTARDRTWWKLDWHQVQLDSAGMQILPYIHADDLRVWVVQSFVEVNAAISAAAYADSSIEHVTHSRGVS